MLLVQSCATGVSQEKYDKVNSDLVSAQSQLSTLQSDYDKANNDLKNIQDQLAKLQSDYDNANIDLAEVQAKHSAVQNDYSTVKSDLTAVQAEINALENRILDLYRARPDTTVEVIKDVEYGIAGDIPLLLDIYIPETPIARPMPAVIFIHGGSWKGGDKATGYEPCMRFAERGFLSVSINYRLMPVEVQGTPEAIAHLSNCVEDCKCAIRWMRANADKYNVDPELIGVWGKSAGGHLAMMVACVDETVGLEGNGGWEEYPSRVQAVVSYFGPTLLKEDWASPINYVTTDDPPLLLVHGELDQTVPIESSEQMYEAYQRVGLEATLIRVSEAGHSSWQKISSPIAPSLDEIEQIVMDFFVEHLVLAD